MPASDTSPSLGSPQATAAAAAGKPRGCREDQAPLGSARTSTLMACNLSCVSLVPATLIAAARHHRHYCRRRCVCCLGSRDSIKNILTRDKIDEGTNFALTLSLIYHESSVGCREASASREEGKREEWRQDVASDRRCNRLCVREREAAWPPSLALHPLLR